MNITEILALYDEEQRRTIEYTSLRREETQHVVRHVELVGTIGGLVIYSWLDENNADEVIREQAAYFQKLGQNLEWKHYEHDTPPDLKSRLAAHGFETDEEEAIVVLDLENIPQELLQPQSPDVRRITDPAQLCDVMLVQDEVWQAVNTVGQREQLAYEMLHAPETISLYVAYAEGQPVSSAWIRFHETSRFASLWGGSTLPAYRRRGIYTAMLAARAQEALERGARFLTVDAGPMSRPILEKLGFQVLTISTPCKWKVK
jgi:predicted GNAT family acetyltransferase